MTHPAFEDPEIPTEWSPILPVHGDRGYVCVGDLFSPDLTSDEIIDLVNAIRKALADPSGDWEIPINMDLRAGISGGVAYVRTPDGAYRVTEQVARAIEMVECPSCGRRMKRAYLIRTWEDWAKDHPYEPPELGDDRWSYGP